MNPENGINNHQRISARYFFLGGENGGGGEKSEKHSRCMERVNYGAIPDICVSTIMANQAMSKQKYTTYWTCT